ncbi:hypothetical protein [Streptomyces lushanensis]|uniref:hypothetical protein n=1 Tax=Streptomyces lushanensis TaxID=1434255 RepID=UPI0008320F97|nr:hypothetical protein [Streptomyces lushanensis]
MVLSLTASGCVTVHGELAVVPSAERSEAARALDDFTDAYNKADKAYDPALDAPYVTGALGTINQAGLKARGITNPNGNAGHQPLELTDAKFTIPKKAGWPRWFVADTRSNRDAAGGPSFRWLVVFLRGGPDKRWEAAYLTILSPDQVPEFRTDKDGWGEEVKPDSASVSVAPDDLSEEYSSYLSSGKPEHFAAGPHTDGWRKERADKARLPGLTTQYVDQPVSEGDFAPLGLRTEDGGALVFFATRFFERQTAAKGVRLQVNDDVRALLTGEVRNTITKEWLSSQTVLVPGSDAAAPEVVVAGRLQGITAAKGS